MHSRQRGEELSSLSHPPSKPAVHLSWKCPHPCVPVHWIPPARSLPLCFRLLTLSPKILLFISLAQAVMWPSGTLRPRMGVGNSHLNESFDRTWGFIRKPKGCLGFGERQNVPGNRTDAAIWVGGWDSPRGHLSRGLRVSSTFFLKFLKFSNRGRRWAEQRTGPGYQTVPWEDCHPPPPTVCTPRWFFVSDGFFKYTWISFYRRTLRPHIGMRAPN